MNVEKQSSAHPYAAFEGTPEWAAIDDAVRALAANRDLIETTGHDYIVGFLCRAIVRPRSVVADASVPTRRDALRKIQEAVDRVNPDRRDLVAELIGERRLEAERE